ncbi:exodeoxyribonuclease VII large subunit [Spiroplasma taiwanense]|uniref:Exodeoxyribonuclease 7 large subunit n=1 Tax=Spiroplasma taiwanense CT-1 TaxID=1276220 RepID=S5MHA9_9MOLU|nr:exodeoxyribonuclease VII large subunit [Spiroplasma taiwanense]AGR41225.1 exodeoxyribonuclease VII large subunit [Spiroplasma taiwanense CT-1]
MSKVIFKISELNENIKNFVEKTNQFKNINIKGEVSNLTFNKSGHIYFSLKDNEARIDCAIWKSNTQSFINLSVKEGTEIIAKGVLTFYKPSGKFTFTISSVKIDGIGELSLIYEKRYNELKDKGLFDQQKKKTIPNIPKNIGIITAASGDAIWDVVTTIKRRFPIVNIFIFPTLVQGEEAAKDISKKIIQADNFIPKLDTLIIGRGGGSYEDLWSFNELEVIYAIEKCTTPVITGIGHEPDTTLSDYVADFSASTPTAAAEKSTPDYQTIINLLNSKLNDFGKNLKNKLDKIEDQVNNYSNKLKVDLNNKISYLKQEFRNSSNIFNSIIKNKLNLITQNFTNSLNNWKRIISHKLDVNKNILNSFNDKIELQNPFLPLSKGYSILKQNNTVIKSIKQIDKTKDIVAIINDGEINLTVKGEKK